MLQRHSRGAVVTALSGTLAFARSATEPQRARHPDHSVEIAGRTGARLAS